MDGSAATQAQVATAIQANPPRPVPNVPCPPLAPLPSLPNVGSSTTLPTAELATACPRQAQWALAILLAVTALLLTAHSLSFLPFGTRPSELEQGELLTYKLDLNQATAGELMQLPGIGPKMAERIIAYREQKGKFHSVADLGKVSGIGPTILKRIEGWVCVNGQSAVSKVPLQAKNQALVEQPHSPTHSSKPAPAEMNAPKDQGWSGPPLDLNTATLEQLQKLPRIGTILSQRIVEERNVRPFTSVDDLKRVKGIGPKTLAGLKPYVTVGK